MELFLGVSSQDWYSEKLFEFVQDNPSKTLLQYRFRWQLVGKEHIIGIPVETDEDGKVSILHLSLALDLWDKDEHCKLVKCQPKVYTLEELNEY